MSRIAAGEATLIRSGAPEEQLELVELEHVGGIADDDGDVAVLAPFRQELIADHQIERNRLKQTVIDLEVLEVDVREAVLSRDAFCARGLGAGVGAGFEKTASCWIRCCHKIS